MKKLISLLIVIPILVIGLAGCSSGKDSGDNMKNMDHSKMNMNKDDNSKK